MNEQAELNRALFGNPLLRALLESLPCGVLFMDEGRRVILANTAFERSLELPKGAVLGKRPGEILGCVNNLRNTHDCEIPEGCVSCEARRMSLQALKEDRTTRGRANFDIAVNGHVTTFQLTMTATPLKHGGKNLAIVVIEDAEKLRELRRWRSEDGLHGMIGGHPLMSNLFDTIRRVGPVDVPVLIQGESGTGKEMVAHALHRESSRSSSLMVSVNAGALPEGLLESELFGHVKGAFTGAVRDKRGRFDLADGGTLFLDEIGEISAGMQVKLLRVLQGGTFEPVGGEETKQVNVRLICATNRDLEGEVQAGRFRSDLYYRLSVVPIRIPPLRERASDVPLLVRHLLDRVAFETGKTVPRIADEAMRALVGYPWPGNVRELENALRFGVINADDGLLRVDHLPPRTWPLRERTEGRPTRPGRLDRARVDEALRQFRGNKLQAARALGVSRATLYRFLDKTKAGPS